MSRVVFAMSIWAISVERSNIDPSHNRFVESNGVKSERRVPADPPCRASSPGLVRWLGDRWGDFG